MLYGNQQFAGQSRPQKQQSAKVRPCTPVVLHSWGDTFTTLFAAVATETATRTQLEHTGFHTPLLCAGHKNPFQTVIGGQRYFA